MATITRQQNGLQAPAARVFEGPAGPAERALACIPRVNVEVEERFDMQANVLARRIGPVDETADPHRPGACPFHQLGDSARRRSRCDDVFDDEDTFVRRKGESAPELERPPLSLGNGQARATRQRGRKAENDGTHGRTRNDVELTVEPLGEGFAECLRQPRAFEDPKLLHENIRVTARRQQEVAAPDRASLLENTEHLGRIHNSS
jgi:hypothetical protein